MNLHWIGADIEDQLLWLPDRAGMYTVKSIYMLNTQAQIDRSGFLFWKKLWGSSLHERQKLLIWKILVGALPVRKRLADRFSIFSVVCPLCNTGEENELHLFFQCPLAKALWFYLPWNVRWEGLFG